MSQFPENGLPDEPMTGTGLRPMSSNLPASNLPASPMTRRIEQLCSRIESGIALRPPVPPRHVEFTPAHHGQPGHVGPSKYWRILNRSRWALAIAICGGGIVGLLYTLPQTPVYQASTTLEVLDVNDGPADLKDGTGANTTVPPINLQTQVDILRSQTLRNRVISKLTSSEKPIDTAPEDTRTWRAVLNLPENPGVSMADILRATAKGVSVSASPLSRIIQVDVKSSNPEIAADYANTLAQEFIDERLESHWQATQRTGEWLTRQLDGMKVRLAASEDELQNYARQTNVELPEDHVSGSAAEEKFRQLQKELSSAQADRIVKQSRYELASKSSIDTLPEASEDPQLRVSREKLADTKRDLAEALTKYVYSGTPQVRALQGQVTTLENEINASRGRILDRIHNDLVAAQTRERLLAQAVNAQTGQVSTDASKTVRYNILKREADANREVYESLLQRVKEAGIASAIRSGNFRVVDQAVPPEIPAGPSLPRGIFAGTLLGIIGGIVFVFLREKMDRSIALPGETSFYLGSPELAVVPSNSIGKDRRKSGGARHRLLIPADEPVEYSVFRQTDSPVAESFRMALTSLLFATRNGSAPQAIAITSAGPNDGRTTVACNLAMSYAEINRRVLLIDGDMRSPRLHSIFGIADESGLATLLNMKGPITHGDLRSVIQPTAVPNLSVIPCGKLNSTVANLLYSPRFAEMMLLARERFDVIVIDTPPVLHLPDARAIASRTDGVIFVVRSQKTLRDTVNTAAERFRQEGIPVLGSILNDWNSKENGHSAQHREEYCLRLNL